MTATVRYPDGVEVTVTEIKQGKITGEGPGFFTGDPVTTFSVKIRNKSSKPLSVDTIVPTLTYGDPLRRAQPVYAEGALDFSGAVAPEAEAKASYAFSIPSSELGDVSLTLDIDGAHSLATFSGAART